MTIVTQELSALLQVLVAGVVLGAGLPALFALGVKSLNTGRVVVAGGPDGEVSKPSTAGYGRRRHLLRRLCARGIIRNRGHHLGQAAVRGLIGRVATAPVF